MDSTDYFVQYYRYGVVCYGKYDQEEKVVMKVRKSGLRFIQTKIASWSRVKSVLLFTLYKLFNTSDTLTDRCDICSK
jgi:hypothetical protein